MNYPAAVVMPYPYWVAAGFVTPLYLVHSAWLVTRRCIKMKDVAKILVQQGIAVFAHGHRNHGILTADFKDACTGEKAWFYKEVEDINNTALY